ncbi:MAG TPA: glycoside hydrolase family 3 N-terminal domain-containing protein, partial [Pseudogracilibacillus sp.]|nr:glycoside hydrolase family 3 N-terminal domain-containing protein [Pseudogracilibacillus sp.]
MKKIMIVAGLFTIVLLLYFVIKDFQYTPQTEMNQTEEQNSEQEDVINDDYSEYGTDKVQDQIEYMTLDEKIGQLFITGISGTELTDKERDKFERNSLGGVIFFGDNFDDPKQAVKLINDFKKLETINQIPLFLSVDQEGG